MSGVSSPATTQTAASRASAIARLSASQARSTTQSRSRQSSSAKRVSRIPCERTCSLAVLIAAASAAGRDELSSGAEGARTPDLRAASATLFQLSYSPGNCARQFSGAKNLGRGRLEQVKANPRALQPRLQGIAHRRRGRHLAGGPRQLVEGETEPGLGQHLRGLAVAGVSAADLGDHPLAAPLADEGDLEPALGASLLARPLDGGTRGLEQELAR